MSYTDFVIIISRQKNIKASYLWFISSNPSKNFLENVLSGVIPPKIIIIIKLCHSQSNSNNNDNRIMTLFLTIALEIIPVHGYTPLQYCKKIYSG